MPGKDWRRTVSNPRGSNCVELIRRESNSGGSVVKNPPANAGSIRDAGLIFGSGRSPGGDYV